MAFFILMPILLILALLVAAGVLAGVVSVFYSLMPFNKVPLRYNLRNLQTRWKTTLVTALAFTLVTALITIMLAFVRGMDRVTQSSAIDGNVIVLADGAVDEVFSNMDDQSVTGLADLQKSIKTMPRKVDGKEVKAPLFSKEVYVLVSHIVAQKSDGSRKRRFIQMRGVSDFTISAAVHGLSVADGEGFQSQSGRKNVESPIDTPTGVSKGSSANALEVVLGSGIAKILGADLGKDTLRAGDILQIGPEICYVKGVFSPAGSFGSEVWALDTQVQQLFNRGNKYSSFVIRFADDEKATEMASKLTKFGSVKYNAFTEKSYYKRLEESNNLFRFTVYFLGAVMAIGGVLGVTNTMFAAISQRSKDIGVLRLLGYTRFQILCSFLFESFLIALLGGVLGCAIGFLFNGITASSVVASQQGGGKSVVLQLVVDGSVLMPALLFALVMGAVGGLIPSVNAMRLKPLESLR